MNTSSFQFRNIQMLAGILVFVLIIIGHNSFAQADSTQVTPNKNWKLDGTFLFHVHESTFTNWASGGDNQLASKVTIPIRITLST